jgi:hypothetical protein
LGTVEKKRQQFRPLFILLKYQALWTLAQRRIASSDVAIDRLFSLVVLRPITEAAL